MCHCLFVGVEREKPFIAERTKMTLESLRGETHLFVGNQLRRARYRRSYPRGVSCFIRGTGTWRGCLVSPRPKHRAPRLLMT